MKASIYLIFISLLLITGLYACSSSSPEELAERSKELHRQLETAKTRADSTAIWKQIVEVEELARGLGKDDAKVFARLAHPDDK